MAPPAQWQGAVRMFHAGAVRLRETSLSETKHGSLNRHHPCSKWRASKPVQASDQLRRMTGPLGAAKQLVATSTARDHPTPCPSPPHHPAVGAQRRPHSCMLSSSAVSTAHTLHAPPLLTTQLSVPSAVHICSAVRASAATRRCCSLSRGTARKGGKLEQLSAQQSVHAS